jgi:hypothetical protein
MLLVSIPIFIAYYGYDSYQCQTAELRYEKVVAILEVLDAT